MFIKLYLITLPVFFAIDMLWLSIVARNFYQKNIGFLMTPNVNLIAAVLFYLLFIAGLVVFVIAPSVIHNSWLQAVLLGSLFGLICYATYDLTNLATIKNWPLLVTIIDLIWGSILSSSVAIISFCMAKKLGI